MNGVPGSRVSVRLGRVFREFAALLVVYRGPCDERFPPHLRIDLRFVVPVHGNRFGARPKGSIPAPLATVVHPKSMKIAIVHEMLIKLG